MSGQELWGGEALDLLFDQRRLLKMAISRFDTRINALSALSKQLLQDRDRLIVGLQELDARLDKLEAWEGDPVVLVRRSVGGYGPTPYHDAQSPCGHVWSRDRFDEMLLGQAEEAGYTPCGFCGFQVRRRRTNVAAA